MFFCTCVLASPHNHTVIGVLASPRNRIAICMSASPHNRIAICMSASPHNHTVICVSASPRNRIAICMSASPHIRISTYTFGMRHPTYAYQLIPLPCIAPQHFHPAYNITYNKIMNFLPQKREQPG